MRFKHRQLLAGAFLAVAACLFACAMPGVAEDKSNAPLKVGFLCVGPITDWGFNYAHDQGRLFLEKQTNGQVQTAIAEKVPESAEAERVLEKMIAKGNKLIFTTSYGFLEPALRVAKRHPDVVFMQINRFQTAANLGTYFSHQYQPMYLAGMVAGRMTKSNKLGFVAAHPIPPLVQAVNSFTLGARSVNPKVETLVVFINNWSDAPLESEAVKSLHENGCDVIAHAQDNQNTIMSACESLGIYSVGFYTDASKLAPKGWLTGACLDWGPFYVKVANTVRSKTWKPSSYTAGMEGKEGYIKLSSFGKRVPAAVQKEVKEKEKLLREGKLVIFQGPMKDRDGKDKIAAGQKLDIKQMAEMNWFVAGVKGSLPAKK
jgi:basic membrane lipoprotein Med (substrate-binding protein (PBP1-ABC) superfamily)